MEAPFILPDQPIDQFEVKFFAVETRNGNVSIQHTQYRYHMCTKAKPESLPGSAGSMNFENEWQITTDGKHAGIFRGWKQPLEVRRGAWFGCFASLENARMCAIATLNEIRLHHRERVQELTFQIDQLQKDMQNDMEALLP